MHIQRPLSVQPLPIDAIRVFKGILFDVYQREVEGYDGSKKVFEKVKRPDTVLIIPVTEEGKILLALDEQPGRKQLLQCVWGRVDEGEDVLGAAQRELLEETGYAAKEWLLFDATQPLSKVERAVYTFVAKGCTRIADQHLDGAEKIALTSVDFDQFVASVLDPDFGDQGLKIKLFEAQRDPVRMATLKELLVG